MLEKAPCCSHHKRELKGTTWEILKRVFCTFTIQTYVKKVPGIKFTKFFDKRVLLPGDEAVISSNPRSLSLFNKTSFLHVAMRKLQRRPSVLFGLLSQNTGTSVPGRCWAGGRASKQRKEEVGRGGMLRLMSETLSSAKGAVPSVPEIGWCYDEPCGFVFTVHGQLKSQKQCLLILVLEERLSHTPW